MKLSRHAISGLLTITLVLGGGQLRAADLSDPLEVIKKSEEAVKKIKSVKYDVVFEGLDEAKTRQPVVEGTFVLMGFSGGMPQKFHADIKFKPPGSEEFKAIVAGNDGNNCYLLDSANRKAYVDMDPAVFGGFTRPIRSGWLMTYVNPDPFADELKATKHELTGSKTIGGEDCYEVSITYPERQAIWYFSKKDLFPRGRIDIREGGKTKFQRMISKLVVDPTLDGDTFKPKIPADYAKTDEFAP